MRACKKKRAKTITRGATIIFTFDKESAHPAQGGTVDVVQGAIGPITVRLVLGRAQPLENERVLRILWDRDFSTVQKDITRRLSPEQVADGRPVALTIPWQAPLQCTGSHEVTACVILDAIEAAAENKKLKAFVLTLSTPLPLSSTQKEKDENEHAHNLLVSQFVRRLCSLTHKRFPL